jgi:uncharacterized membrane protein HdeD (DUF308 family)
MMTVRLRTRLAGGPIATAFLLLAGILLIASGFFSGTRISFYAGLTITLLGIFNGIRRIVTQSHSAQSRQ